MSEYNVTAAAVSVVNHERKSARMESTYDGLAAHLMLTPDTSSEDMTNAARLITVLGAVNDGTATGKALTEDMLKGRNPGPDAAHLSYWKAARTVRIGLVNAVKRANPTDSSEEDTTDYLAKIIAAVDNGVSHNLNAADIAKAVTLHVESLLS